MNVKLKNVFEKLEMLKDAIEQFSREVDEERVIIIKESFSKIIQGSPRRRVIALLFVKVGISVRLPVFGFLYMLSLGTLIVIV